MPLPDAGQKWPPEAHQDALARMRVHDAWYAGDPDRLYDLYRTQKGARVRPSQLAGGVVGRLARWFWGQPTATNEQRAKLHVPLAADIATTSADLLFSEPPSITVDGEDSTKTQDRLEELADLGGLHARLLEGAEVASALSGVYLRVAWDEDLADYPFVTPVHADAALPEFRYGILTAVTFWRELASDSSSVWRHVERYERGGVILHGLYEGDKDKLGRPRDLGDHPETNGLAPEVKVEGVNGLLAGYVPNMRPNRRDRGSALGRSDFDGVEGLFDALDEVYSSWMRDIRLGKARILVPSAFLDSLGPGQGAAWNADREVYEQLSIPPTADGNLITPQQFEIRFEEHQQTAEALVRQAVETAGYSSQTFGLQGDGAAVTATEVTSRERRSYTTRRKKINYWRSALSGLLETLLIVDRAIFQSDIDPVRPALEFPDGVSDSALTLAQTASALRGARAASTETLVRLVRPEWDDDQVRDEVAAILAEEPAPVADPTQMTGGDMAGGEGDAGEPPDTRG